ncbi:hypothetical protein BJ508DRAFT_3622 [Ascobolus immersus RN42]|uniref:Uncharacterized protein n=1 Tax=Ascobolus immersus RN42 TaxID=1160509 RepID=A0A3N4IPS8_ASCIM|nr:hypothetical protein BJ508DRAFT_3622 [Ascobolus immersus RN42]
MAGKAASGMITVLDSFTTLFTLVVGPSPSCFSASSASRTGYLKRSPTRDNRLALDLHTASVSDVLTSIGIEV